jgi:hypothetical protein
LSATELEDDRRQNLFAGEALAAEVEAGVVFVNRVVKSDPGSRSGAPGARASGGSRPSPASAGSSTSRACGSSRAVIGGAKERSPEEGPMAVKRAGKTRWVRDVKTVSTYPPEGTFTKDAEAIARTMASKKVSPKGIGSGIRMIQFFINRAGKNLSPERREELEKAKGILRAKARERE